MTPKRKPTFAQRLVEAERRLAGYRREIAGLDRDAERAKAPYRAELNRTKREHDRASKRYWAAGETLRAEASRRRQVAHAAEDEVRRLKRLVAQEAARREVFGRT